MNQNMIRSNIFKGIRTCLYEEGYIEVTSAILRSCNSKINPRFALENEKYLRDGMDLYLQRNISTTCPKVFEMGPCFRKDKVDETHSSEFFMVEVYSKDEYLSDMIKLVSRIITTCLPFIKNIKEVSVRDLILADLGIDISTTDTGMLIDCISDKYPHIEKRKELPHLTVNRYIELYIESTLKEKNCLYFLIEYPVCTITVAKRKNDSNCIQRFECFINGLEIANGFEDCMDVNDVEGRVKISGIMGPEEKELINLMKEDKLYPTSGVGIGVDRLCLLMSREINGGK